MWASIPCVSWIPVGSPESCARGAYLGGGHHLSLRFAGIQKCQQRVALCVDIEPVILRGAVRQLGHLQAIMLELLEAASIQKLKVGIVAAWWHVVWIVIEPTHEPTAVRKGNQFGLHLVGTGNIG